MSAQLSTLGQVLKWVSQQLQEVERNMDDDNKVIKGSLIKAYQSIDTLVGSDGELSSTSDNVIANDEYQSLVNMIQSHRTTLTLESITSTIETLRKSGASEEEIQDVEKRMRRTLGLENHENE